MKKETIQQFLDKWVYIRRVSGFFYKARIIEVTDSEIIILDRDAITSVFPLSDISEISEWKEKNHG